VLERVKFNSLTSRETIPTARNASPILILSKPPQPPSVPTVCLAAPRSQSGSCFLNRGTSLPLSSVS
ncbi:hypothetical protein BGY98DRAFT_943208, partial [Russula aff. rugulosa BPL654]